MLSADGVISLIGCLLGNPFINAVYIGHPGWKAMGGRIGYSAATGAMVLVLTWLGIVALVSSLIPVVAILPILLYIGMLIGSQAFQETPRSHAPAIILANWVGGVRYFQDVPGGLVAIAAGTLIAWGSNVFGLGYGGLSVATVGDAFSHFGFSFPVPAVGHVFSGFKFIGIILVTAIPFGIYDLDEAMDNVESAAAAGDSFPTTQVLSADGVISHGCC